MSGRTFAFYLEFKQHQSNATLKCGNSGADFTAVTNRKNIVTFSMDNRGKFTRCRYLIGEQMLGATSQPEANSNLRRSRLSPRCLLFTSELLIREGLV